MNTPIRSIVLLVGACAIAAPLAAHTRPVVIKAARVIGGKGGILTNVAIVVQGSKIVRIEPAGTTATYDLTTQTVMPGMIDTHTHISDHFNRSNGRLHTADDPETPLQTTQYAYEYAYKKFMAGFTTIQSPGNPVDKDIRDWINEGRMPGRHRRDCRGARPQRGGADLSGAGRRSGAHGRDCDRHVTVGRVAAPWESDRRDCPRHGGRHHRRRRQSAAGRHGRASCDVRDERRSGVQGRRSSQLVRFREPGVRCGVTAALQALLP
jgi:hypothetical protein